MKTSNVNAPGERSHGIVRGHVGRGRAGSTGQTFLDIAGNEVTAPDTTVIGISVSGDDGDRSYLTVTGTGGQHVNDSGGDLEYGDVVVIDTDGTLITTTTAQDTRPVGVVQQAGHDGDPVSIISQGYAAQVNTTGTVLAGQYLETSTSAGLAQVNSTRRTGSFGVALADGPNPPALLFGIPDSVTTTPGGGVVLVLSGSLSEPPTEAEIEALVGLPAAVMGTPYLISDSSSGRHYYAISNGTAFEIVPALGPAEPHSVTVTSSPAGGWTQITNDRAASGGNGKTYVGYVRGNNGDVCVRSITESTGVADTERVMHAALEVDIHDAPSLLIADDRHLYVAYSKHLGTEVYLRKSTATVDADPTLASGFGAEATLDSQLGGTHYTYIQLAQLLSEAGSPMYLFYRDHQSSDTIVAWAYSSSTDHGVTWAAQTSFLSDAGGRGSYITFASDGLSRIDMGVADGHPVGDAPTDVYHMYFTGGSFYETDGTAILTALPLNATDGTLVYDASANSNQSGWPVNLTNVDGYPTMSYQILLTPGTDCADVYGRWSGSAWVSTTIVNCGGVIELTVGPQATVDRQSPDIVYAPVKVAGKYEIREYRTADSGASFSLLRAITSGSAVDNFHVVSVRDASPALRVLWLAGSYTTYLIYSMGIGGLAGASTTHTIETLQRLVTVRDTKANVIAFTATAEEILLGYATDTAELGVYTNGAWVWIGATTFGTPAVVLGTAAAAGAATTAIRTDATIVAFDATAPANVAGVGVAGSTGSVAKAARRDHAHALTYHDEPLTDGASNFIFDGGDIIVVTGVPN